MARTGMAGWKDYQPDWVVVVRSLAGEVVLASNASRVAHEALGYTMPKRNRRGESCESRSSLRGLPGSGKSTVAREMVTSRPGEVAIVSRDVIREHVLGVRFLPALEDVVTQIEDGMARTLLASGTSVIVDATNLRAKYLNRWRELAAQCRAEFQVVWVDTPVEECITRDAKRENPVGEDVIRRMDAARHASQVETTLDAVPETARGPVPCQAMENWPGPPVRCKAPAAWEVMLRCASGDEWANSVCDDHLGLIDDVTGRTICHAHGAVTVTVAAYPLGTS